MPVEIFDYLPQQWIGAFAVVMFVMFTIAQLVEKFPIIAKHVPLGKWWHSRQKKKTTRGAWIAEDNEVITGLQTQITTIAADLAEVNRKVRTFTAWSVYDARYHHRIEITHADCETCLLPRHYDFFEFENMWNRDPVAASAL